LYRKNRTAAFFAQGCKAEKFLSGALGAKSNQTFSMHAARARHMHLPNERSKSPGVWCLRYGRIFSEDLGSGTEFAPSITRCTREHRCDCHVLRRSLHVSTLFLAAHRIYYIRSRSPLSWGKRANLRSLMVIGELPVDSLTHGWCWVRAKSIKSAPPAYSAD
jgi:hypothetical protein